MDWQWNKLNNKTYLVKLKEDVYWQNGNKFVASDVEYTINYIKKYKGIYYANVENIETLEIINENTIKIFLKEPEENFEYMLCFPIICEDENIGTGKFKISNITDDECILESSNRQIVVKIYENMTSLYTAFTKEEVDIITTTNINYQNYIGTVGYEKQMICGRNFDFLKINLNNKILANKEVVEALSYAINKKQITYNVYNNVYLSTECPMQYGSYLYNNNIDYEYDTSKAKQILKETGWNFDKYWTKDGQILKLDILTNRERAPVANIIKENLEDIGIPVTVREISDDYYKNNFQSLNYTILLTGNIVSIKPEIQEYVSFKIKRLQNEKETFEQIYIEYNETRDFIGLYFNSIIILHSKKIKGNFNGNWYNIFYNVDSWHKVY